jgi:hypothetical protein
MTETEAKLGFGTDELTNWPIAKKVNHLPRIRLCSFLME